MEELLRFFLKRSKFLMFLILEIVAFTLIFKGNDFQRSSFLKHTATISANAYGVSSSIGDYFQLRQTNELLAAENTRLKNELEQMLFERATMQMDSMTTFSQKNDVHYINAKVVYSSSNKLQNYIILNRGSRDGVLNDLGVVFNQNVVGVVQYTTEHYSVVLPIINNTQRISAKNLHDNQLGTIVWDGINNSVAQLEEIPRHATPQVGDSIVTSGYSAIFPEGYLIGKIKSTKCRPSDAFFEIQVNLAIDFNALTYVSVVLYDNKVEMDSILNTIPNER